MHQIAFRVISQVVTTLPMQAQRNTSYTLYTRFPPIAVFYGASSLNATRCFLPLGNLLVYATSYVGARCTLITFAQESAPPSDIGCICDFYFASWKGIH